jgi:hypothetical protein
MAPDIVVGYGKEGQSCMAGVIPRHSAIHAVERFANYSASLSHWLTVPDVKNGLGSGSQLATRRACYEAPTDKALVTAASGLAFRKHHSDDTTPWPKQQPQRETFAGSKFYDALHDVSGGGEFSFAWLSGATHINLLLRPGMKDLIVTASRSSTTTMMAGMKT